MKNIVNIILEAQKQLVLKPIDLAHDITHHYRVYEWSLKINNSEKLNADEDLLTICAWYHDLGERRGEDIDFLKKLLRKNINNVDLINKIIGIIREHSYGETQTSLESKILFDADKMEYVNPFRLLWFIQTYKDGPLNKEKYIQYKKEWKERIVNVKKMMHFPSSRKEFIRLLPTAEKIMKS